MVIIRNEFSNSIETAMTSQTHLDHSNFWENLKIHFQTLPKLPLWPELSTKMPLSVFQVTNGGAEGTRTLAFHFGRHFLMSQRSWGVSSCLSSYAVEKMFR